MGKWNVSANEIFLKALEHDNPDHRRAYLDEACRSDVTLRTEVDSLLAARDQVGSFLESPAPRMDATIDQPIAEKPGSVLGPYKLMQQIGEGGMGVVYMAEQKEPVKRRVALKIIKPGMDTRQVIARFEAEQQALAAMDHPNIAKVLDAGATDSGRPYFVMELVNGISLTQYCDEQHLTPRERLELFVPICQAIQHAHQKGIIHRDLKPSNILVALYDGRPVPKVIDFGVAKATNQSLTDKTMFTGLGQIVGTLEYMSPEQAQRNQLDVDTRTDIYSLGVILYELLTGDTPFDRQRLRSAAFDEMLRIIREEEPPKPSTKVSSSEALPSIAANRHTEPQKLSILVRGELDWIVMKALEKDRARRYETANGFANDIRRYMNDEPVMACPPSVGYRFRKFARRNKAALATGAVIAATLIFGLLGTSWQATRAIRAQEAATKERDRALEAEQIARDEAERADLEAARAKTEAAIAKAVNEFVNEDLLGSADPHDAPHRDLKVREVLDRASRNIEGRFTDQPLVKAHILQVIGNAYDSLGEYEKAKQHLERSRQLHRQVRGADHAGTMKIARSLAWVYHNQAEYARSRQLLQDTLSHSISSLGSEDPFTLNLQHGIADIDRHLGLYAESEDRHRDALDIQRRVLGPEHTDTLAGMGNLGLVILSQGRNKEAEELFADVLQMKEDLHGRKHLKTLPSMYNLALAISNQGRFPEAEKLYFEVLEISQSQLGSEHPDTLRSMHGVATAIHGQGRYKVAEKQLAKVLEARKRILGETHVHTQESANSLASSLLAQDELEKAETIWTELLEVQRRVNPADHPSTLGTLNNLATTYLYQGRNEKAQQLQAKVLAIRQRTLGEKHPDTLSSKGNLALSILNQGRHEDAEKLLNEVLDAYTEVSGPEHPDTLTATLNLALAHRKQKSYADAEELYSQALHILRRSPGPEHPNTLTAMNGLAFVYCEQGSHPEAGKLYREIWNTQRQLLGPKHPQTLESMRSLTWALMNQNRLEEAGPLAREVACLQGDALRESGDDEAAIVYYRRAIDLRDDRARPHVNLGVALQNLGDHESATVEFQTAITRLEAACKRSPVNKVARKNLRTAVINLGASLAKQGQHTEAMVHLNRAIKLGARGHRTWSELAQCHLALNNTEEYEEVCSSMIANFPELSERSIADWGHIGQAFYRVAKYGEARKTLEKVIELREDDGPSLQSGPRWWYYTMTLWRLGEFEIARAYFDQLVDLVQQDPPANLAVHKRLQLEVEALLGCYSEPEASDKPST